MLRFARRMVAAMSVSLALSFLDYALETLRLLTSRSITLGVKIQRLPETFIPS